jgi:hypothetical protein
LRLEKGKLFAGLCVLAAVAIAGLLFYGRMRNAAAPTGDVSGSKSRQLPAGESHSTPPIGATRIYFRYSGTDSHYGKLAYVDRSAEAAHNSAPVFIDELSCEVAYVAAGSGICLQAARGVVTTYSAVLFDSESVAKRATVPLNGVPSRNRVSPDGRLAASTVFVSGHGYASLDFSTQTMLLDARSGKPIADLETFRVIRDGERIQAADFNFWGVTFTPDSKAFYATLSTGGQHLLVRGNIEAREATVIHSGIECPSVSPDGTRVAYKKRRTVGNRVEWDLHVLNLRSGADVSLKESRSIDDQLEWLDSANVLYTLPNSGTATTEVWVAAADGKQMPALFLRNASSPAAVRAEVAQSANIDR